MNHSVYRVKTLYEDAVSLYNNVVLDNTDAIINDLNIAIENLKNNWKGMDAEVQILKVVNIYNDLIVLRNSLAILALNMSQIAVKYRNVQILNGANLQWLSPIRIDKKVKVNVVVDSGDFIDIAPSAAIGRTYIEKSEFSIKDLIEIMKKQKIKFFENWTVGLEYKEAVEALDNFLSKSNTYLKELENISICISNALKQYLI